MPDPTPTAPAPSCPSCSAAWSARNVIVWNVDGADQCEDGRFGPPTYNLKIQCHVCGVEWFRSEEDAVSDYGERDAKNVVCPVCTEEIEGDDGTEQGGLVYHYSCLGECDE